MKKIITLILIMSFTIAYSAFAYNDVVGDENNSSLELLSTLKIMSGYDDGNFYPDNQLTRGQLAKIAVSISDLNNLTSVYAGTSPFFDVPYTHWAANYISVVTRNGILTGYQDGSYRPEDMVTFEQAVTVCVRLLGYTDTDVQGVWPEGYIAKAISLGLTDGVNSTKGEAISRINIANMIYNLLFTKAKSSSGSSQRYIETMGYKYYENTAIIASNNEDSTIDKGYVYTSSGTFKMYEEMIGKYIYRTGNMVVDKYNTVISFIPREQKIASYIVNLTYENKFTYYDNGDVKVFELDGNQANVLYKTTRSAWSATYSTINTGHTIKVVTDENNNIMYMVLLKNDLKGPITVMGDSWKSDLGINGAFKVIKNGETATESDIKQLNSVYYSSTANIVWVYDKKVTGILENVLPSRDKATSVVVSGTTYTVDSVTASVKLGADGGFSYGDTVVLMFGRDNKVVDVVRPSDNSTMSLGFLSTTGTKTLTDSNGNSQTVFFSNLMLKDGTVQELVTDTDYSDYRGNLMEIKFKGNKAVFNSVSMTNNLDGVFSYKDLAIGSQKVSKDVDILEVVANEQYYDGSCITVFPQRIDGVRLDWQDILYYTKNSVGDIDFLVLDNITGDGDSYGFVIKSKIIYGTKSTSANYTFNIGGKLSNTSSSNTVYFAQGGQAAKFKYLGTSLAHVDPLIKIRETITAVDDLYLYTDKQKLLLGKNVLVYKFSRSPDLTENYLPMDLSEVKGKKDLNLEAYYDNMEVNGGRIRVIVIK